MTDYIKREDALDSLRDGMCGTGYQTMAMDCLNEIYVPSADVAPVRHGHWIKISPAGIYECSECGKNVMTSDIEAYEYCHGCGARMDEGETKE